MSKTQSKSLKTERVTEEAWKNDLALLLRTPLLANIRTDSVRKLLEGAQRCTYKAGQLPSPEDELYILVKGSLELRKKNPHASSWKAPEGAHTIKLSAPDVLGPYLSDEHPLRQYEVRTREEGTELLRVKDSFWPLFEQDPDFQRAVLRHYFRYVKRAPGALLRPTPFGRKATPSSPPPILVLRNGTGKPLPLAGLADLLAASVARQFQEHVRVLHLSPKVKSAGEYTASRQVVSNDRPVKGWVESEWLPMPDSPEAVESAILWAARRGAPETSIMDEVSLVLVDAGDASFIPTGGEIDFVYLCDESICSPRGLPQELVRAQHSQRPAFDILYTALLPKPGKLAERERTWPLGTVRLSLKPKFLQKLAQETQSPGSAKFFDKHLQGKVREKEFTEADGVIARWARAVTGRRVGVALGGGGAYGYVHIALLRELRRERVPVELVSGSSFGSLVGAFYATQPETTPPDKLLCLVEKTWLLPTLVVTAGLVSSRPMAKVIDQFTRERRLDELDLPMFPVVADADSGSEWDLREARIGDGIRASSALPPMAPAIIGERTYLDGGVVANVPVDVLQDEGAGLVIASNCITVPRLRHRLSASPWWNVVREIATPRRLEDLFYRMALLMMRGAGNNQAQRADVVYEPPPSELRNPVQFCLGPALVKSATDSLALTVAVEKTRELWRGIGRHGAGMVRLTDAGTLVVEPPLRFAPEEATFQDHEGGTKSNGLPKPLQDFFAHNSSLAFTLVVPASNAKLASERARALRKQIVKTGISPSQLSMAWNQEGDEVSFRDVRWLSAELRNQLVDADRQLRDVSQSLQSGALVDAWALACGLGKRLQTPTAQRFLRALEPSLRQLLANQGRPLPLLGSGVGTQAFYVVWCDDGRLGKNHPLRDDRLAVGGNRGVQLWTGLATGKVQSNCYTTDVVAGLTWHSSGELACTTFNALLVFTPSEAGDLGTPVEKSGGEWARWGTTFSADGSQVLSSTGSRNLVRYPAGNPSEARVACGLKGEVKRAVTSPTSGWTAAVTMEGNLLLWHGDVTKNQPTILSIEGGAGCLEWHPIDDVLAVGTGMGVELFDLRDSACVEPRRTCLEVPGPVGQVAWSPGMNEKGVERLAVLGEDVRIWDGVISGPGALVMVLQPDTGLQIGMQWHPGGEYLATWNTRATVWNVWSGRVVAQYGGARAQLAMAAWSPTGRYLALCSSDGKVRVWEPSVVGLVRYSHKNLGAGALELPKALPLRCADWHPTDNCVASASADGSVHLWAPMSKSNGRTWLQLLESVSPPSPSFTAWSSGGQLATVRANELEIWSFPRTSEASDFTQRKPVQSMALGFARRVNPAEAVPWLRWSSDQRKLAVCNGWELQVWDVVRAERLWHWKSPSPGDEICWANWSPDGNQLAVALFRGTSQLVIWSATAPDRENKHPVSSQGLWDVAFSPDGKWIAIGSNFELKILDAATCTTQKKVLWQPDNLGIHNLAWSPDGKLLAICNAASKVDIYDTETWDSVVSPTTKQPMHKVTELLWRGGGSGRPLLLLISTQGGEILAWGNNPWGWEGISTLARANGKAVDCLSLSSDGKHLVVSGADGIAQVLPVDPETLLTEVGEMAWASWTEQVRTPPDLDEDEDNEAAA